MTRKQSKQTKQLQERMNTKNHLEECNFLKANVRMLATLFLMAWPDGANLKKYTTLFLSHTDLKELPCPVTGSVAFPEGATDEN